MTTVQIAYEVPAVTVAKIEAHLDALAARDINWNGATFEIERSEFTCIADDSVDEYEGTKLLQEIFRIINCQLRGWQDWEAGKRRMHPALWELWRIKTGAKP